MKNTVTSIGEYNEICNEISQLENKLDSLRQAMEILCDINTDDEYDYATDRNTILTQLVDAEKVIMRKIRKKYNILINADPFTDNPLSEREIYNYQDDPTDSFYYDEEKPKTR